MYPILQDGLDISWIQIQTMCYINPDLMVYAMSYLVLVLATICEELLADSAVLLYVSASGKVSRGIVSLSTSAGTPSNSAEVESRAEQQVIDIASDANSMSPMSSPQDSPITQGPAVQDRGRLGNGSWGGLCLGSRGNGGLNTIYPGDIIPFTRKPLFIIIDSDSSNAFKAISGAERGEPAALLLSPTIQPACANTSSTDSFRYPNGGNLFTFFLTAPLQAFCRLVGLSASNLGTGAYDQADKLLSSFLSDWGTILALSHSLDLVWARIMSDPFLRRLILRFIFCRACLTLYVASSNKKECTPECLPRLPDEVLPTSSTVESCIFHLANRLQVVDHFKFSTSFSISEGSSAERQQHADSASGDSIRNQTSDMTLDSCEIQEVHFVEENGH